MTEAQLPQTLRRLGGHASSVQLQQALNASQATVSRWLAPLVADGRVVKVGAARSQRYLLPREVAGVGTQVVVHEVQADGTVRAFGTLYPLSGGTFWMEENDKNHGRSEHHINLPWFVYDARPQGFLGRAFVQIHAALQLPPQIGHWNDEHILRALCQAGEDLPGNLLLGSASLQRFWGLASPLRSTATVVTEPQRQYPALAEQALGQALNGSSAGGEQPKFTAVVGGHPVIVKFSPTGDNPAAQRWRDLLVCEALALQTLSEAGVAAAHTEIVVAGGRVFLQSQRFDRTAQGGRVGMVSLEAYDARYVGLGNQWSALAALTHRAGSERLNPSDVQTLCLLDAYGALIANNDRHHGNVSLLLHDNRWQLAPAYDMLPMLYAPVAGEVVPREWHIQTSRPNEHTLGVWPTAQALARRFWLRAAADERISPEFRELALSHTA